MSTRRILLVVFLLLLSSLARADSALSFRVVPSSQTSYFMSNLSRCLRCSSSSPQLLVLGLWR